MSCRDVREALDALLDGELEAGEELTVREHLDDCSLCAVELADLREWHGTLAEALTAEGAELPAAERRRTADAVIAAVRRPRAPLARWAALIAIGLSVGVVTCAVSLSRPPQEQVARVVERIREREHRGAELRALSREIEEDLGAAQQVVAGRGAEDPAACAVAVGSTNIARRLTEAPAPPANAPPGVRLSISRSVNGDTIRVAQMNDGRVVVSAPGQQVEVRGMEELRSRHPELCRLYAIGGTDGFLSVGDSTAGADWKGRLDLLLHTGAWDESVQWEAYRGWVASRAADAREIERRVRDHQERCRTAPGSEVPAVPEDVEAIVKTVKTLTRAELQRTQERIDAEMKKLEARLHEAAQLRARARGLRVFAEDVTRE